MKNLRLPFSMLAALAFLTFSSCQKDDSLEPALEIDFNDSEFQLEDLDALENTVIVGGAISDTLNVSVDRKSDKPLLSDILSKLNLSDRQKLAIRGFMQEHAGCAAVHRLAVHKIHHELIRHANAVRAEYLASYKAGTITREELDQKLVSLKAKLREEIMASEARKMHLHALRRCRMELFTKIESVLSPEQLPLWNRWMQNR